MPRKPAAEKGKAQSKQKARAATTKKQKGSRDVVDHALMRGLSHPLRTRILAVLNERVSSPNLLSKELHEGLSQVSYHVERLKKLGLIEMTKTEPRRGAVEHFYRGVRQILVPRSAWKDLPASILSGISAKILENFFDDAQGSIEAGIFDDPDSYAGWSPLILTGRALSALTSWRTSSLRPSSTCKPKPAGGWPKVTRTVFRQPFCSRPSCPPAAQRTASGQPRPCSARRGNRRHALRHLHPPTYPQASAARAAVKGAKRPTPEGVDRPRARCFNRAGRGRYRPIPKPRSMLLVAPLVLASCCSRPRLR